jgi:hypothetical protein
LPPGAPALAPPPVPAALYLVRVFSKTPSSVVEFLSGSGSPA